MADECEHGSLRRSCPRCEDADTIATLTRDLAAARAGAGRLRVALVECADAMDDDWSYPDVFGLLRINREAALAAARAALADAPVRGDEAEKQATFEATMYAFENDPERAP